MISIELSNRILLLFALRIYEANNYKMSSNKKALQLQDFVNQEMIASLKHLSL